MSIKKINLVEDKSKETLRKSNTRDREEFLCKIKPPNKKFMSIEIILTEIFTPLVTLILGIAGLGGWVSDVQNPFLIACSGLLMLSLVFYNIARGIKKLRESKNQNSDKDE